MISPVETIILSFQENQEEEILTDQDQEKNLQTGFFACRPTSLLQSTAVGRDLALRQMHISAAVAR